jgi:hypothetical protein
MNLFSATPRSPYLFAYLSLLPGCLLGAFGLFVYSLISGPGSVDVATVLVALVLVFVWCGYSLAVGVLLITVYVLPSIWVLMRARTAGPLPMFVLSVLPGIVLYLGWAQYQKFALFLLGFGACVGLSYCLLAYRKPAAERA